MTMPAPVVDVEAYTGIIEIVVPAIIAWVAGITVPTAIIVVIAAVAAISFAIIIAGISHAAISIAAIIISAGGQPEGSGDSKGDGAQAIHEHKRLSQGQNQTRSRFSSEHDMNR